MARVTDYTLERYLLGELSEEARAALELSIGADAELAARVEAIRTDTRRFDPASARPFAQTLVARHRSEMRRRYATGATLALAAAALLAVGFASIVGPTEPPDTEVPEEIRAKGAILKIYRQSGEEVDALQDGEVILPGSTVQLALTVGGIQGAVYSVDGRGSVTRHLPTGGATSTSLPAGPLPTAFTLDTVPDFERFFLVTADGPFDLAPVEAALEDLRGDADETPVLSPELHVRATLLRKVNP